MNKTISKKTPSEELFKNYMHLISKQESDVLYRMKTPMGEGIMHRYPITKGIDYVYSEIEAYTPLLQEQKKLVNYLEIMYMVDGHADFEMENRRCASADKGDVLVFSSNVGVKNCTIGPEGMICISLIVFVDLAVNYLNEALETYEFTESNFYKEAREAGSCICVQANERLENIFKDMMALPAEHGAIHRKLLALQAIVMLNDLKNKRKYNDIYFSGDSCEKVHKARRILSKNLLLQNELSVTEVSGLCGYTNASKFSMAFKDTVGMLPGKWKKAAMEKI